MEAEIGVPLLHRHARGVTMTEAGEVLARHARPLLAQQQRLRRAMHAFACGQRGRCACSPTPRRCRPFCRGSSPPDGSAPGGADRNRRTHQRGYRQLYPAGVAQAGVVSDAVDPGPLRLDPVADDPLVLIVPPARPLAEKQEVAFAAVLNEPLVALYQTSALQQHIEQHAAELGGAKRSGQDEPFCRALRDGGARRRRGDPAARYCRALPAALFVCRHRVTGPLGAAPFVPVLSG